MNRKEALEELQKGNKIAHQDFIDGEYLEMVDNVITTEDGFDFTEQFNGFYRFENNWIILDKRVESMNWWNNLSSSEKTRLCDNNTNLIGSVRRWETLTGSEIEKMYSSITIDSKLNKKDMYSEKIIDYLEGIINEFGTPHSDVQIGRKFQASETLERIKALDTTSDKKETRYVCKTVIDGKDRFLSHCEVEGEILRDLVYAHFFTDKELPDLYTKESTGAYDMENDIIYDSLTWTVEEVELSFELKT